MEVLIYLQGIFADLNPDGPPSLLKQSSRISYVKQSHAWAKTFPSQAALFVLLGQSTKNLPL